MEPSEQVVIEENMITLCSKTSAIANVSCADRLELEKRRYLLEPDVWRGLSLHKYSHTEWTARLIVLKPSGRLSNFYTFPEWMFA